MGGGGGGGSMPVKTRNHWKLDGNSCRVLVQLEVVVAQRSDDDDDELMLNVLRCHLTY